MRFEVRSLRTIELVRAPSIKANINRVMRSILLCTAFTLVFVAAHRKEFLPKRENHFLTNRKLSHGNRFLSDGDVLPKTVEAALASRVSFFLSSFNYT